MVGVHQLYTGPYTFLGKCTRCTLGVRGVFGKYLSISNTYMILVYGVRTPSIFLPPLFSLYIFFQNKIYIYNKDLGI